jgi:hypothetical protein
VAARPTPAKKSAAAPAAPAWQTWVTVLLILHLFFLGLGLFSNSGGGKSLLTPALRQIPLVREYLQLLWMDNAYDFDVASPLPDDGDHNLELTIDGPLSEGDVDTLPAFLPTETMQPGIRRMRYQALAKNVAYFDELFADNSDLRTELPLAIATSWLAELKAPPRSYRFICHRVPAERLPKAVERAPGKPREGGPRMAGPALFAEETIVVHLVWNSDDGTYQASRAEPAGQTAEVVRPKPSGATEEKPSAEVGGEGDAPTAGAASTGSPADESDGGAEP